MGGKNKVEDKYKGNLPSTQRANSDATSHVPKQYVPAANTLLGNRPISNVLFYITERRGRSAN
jgi:hypothetical protein